MSDLNQERVTTERGDVSGVVVRGSSAGFAQEIIAGRHPMASDEPVSAGGTGCCCC
jgi:hypothetical protein